MSSPRRIALACAVFTAMAVLAGLFSGSADAAWRPSGPTCGNVTLYKSTGGRWQCSWADEFNDSSIDPAKWYPMQTSVNGFTNGGECFVNSKNNISEGGGVLSLTVRQEAAPFTCSTPYGSYTTQYTGGSLTSWNRYSTTYGRFEVRAKLPGLTTPGLQESFWLWPTDSNRYGAYPASGEIDWAEIFSQYNDRAIPYVHYTPATTDPNVTNTKCLISDVTAWHTYALEWTASSLTFIYDGTTCLVDSWNPAAPLVKPAPFNQPFFINLTQALGRGSNSYTATGTPLVATTQIDYIRVWK